MTRCKRGQFMGQLVRTTTIQQVGDTTILQESYVETNAGNQQPQTNSNYISNTNSIPLDAIQGPVCVDNIRASPAKGKRKKWRARVTNVTARR